MAKTFENNCASTTVKEMLLGLHHNGQDVSKALRRVNKAPGLAGLGVTWNGRLRTSAGRATLSDKRGYYIELNPRLWDEGWGAVRHTFLHELAHLIARVPGHGEAWRRAMASLGVYHPEQYHDYGSIKRKLRVVGKCRGCGYEVKRVQRLRSDKVYLHSTSKGGCGAEIGRPDGRLRWSFAGEGEDHIKGGR